MKKYWKLTVTVIVIIVTFITFYTHTTSISKSFPQFTVETIEGDESYAEPIVMSGDYYSSYTMHEPLKITKDGTTYLRDEDFITRMYPFYNSLYIDKLQTEYRSFMRGKEDAPYSFAETDERLFYATLLYNRFGIPMNKIELEVLDKTTKQAETFSIVLEENVDLFGYVSKVVAFEDEVSIVVQSEDYGDDGTIERTNTRFYIFDVVKQEVVHHEMIPLDHENEYPEYFNVLVAEENGKPIGLALAATKIEYVTVDGELIHGEEALEHGITYEMAETKTLQLYDFATKKIEEISLENYPLIGYPISYSGGNVVFLNVENKEMTFKTYDLSKKEVTKEKRIPVDLSYVSLWEIVQGVSKDHLYYSYMMTEDYKSGFIHVVDTETLELVYKGEITSEERAPLKDYEEITIHSLELNDK